MTKARQLADLISSGSIETGEITSLDASKLTGTIADARVPASAVTQHANNYVHPNHTGEVTSTADGATVISNTAITGQTAITSLADTDKFLVSDVSDSGNLKYVEKQYLPSGTFVEIADSKNVNATGNITLDNIFTSDYIMYKIFGVFVPATNGDSLLMTLRSSAPADLTGNNYRYVVNAVRNPSNNSVETGYNSNDGTSSFNLHYGGNNSGVDYPMNFEIDMFDPRSSFVAGKNINYRCSFYGNDSKMYISVGAGTYKASGDAYGFKLAFSSGDIKRHKVTVFGIKGTDIA